MTADQPPEGQVREGEGGGSATGSVPTKDKGRKHFYHFCQKIIVGCLIMNYTVYGHHYRVGGY